MGTMCSICNCCWWCDTSVYHNDAYNTYQANSLNISAHQRNASSATSCYTSTPKYNIFLARNERRFVIKSAWGN